MKRFALLAALAALAIGGALRAQRTTLPEQQTPFVFKSTVGEVLVQASVLDKQHRSVETLTQPNFQVFENGVAQRVDYFAHEDAAVSIGIVVDNSGSMRDKRPEVSRAALNFVRTSNPGDEVFVVNFNEEYYLDAEFTNSIPKLQQGLDQIESRGGTALYDAIIASLDYLNQNGKHDKKVLLVVTDGDDDASRYTLEQTVRIAQTENSPLIYCIGLIDQDPLKGRAERALKGIADATGGVAFFPKNLDQVDSITRQVAADIRSQYTLAYKSNQTGSGFRAIRVEVNGPKLKDLKVRARTGYYQPGPNAGPGG